MNSWKRLCSEMAIATLISVTVAGCGIGPTPASAPTGAEPTGQVSPQPTPVAPTSAAAPSTAPIKVLMPVSLTGSNVALDSYVLNGAQIAADEINSSGGVNGRPIKIIVEDTQSTVDGAIAAYQKLTLSNPDAAALYVPLLTTYVTALMPYIEKEGITTFTGASAVSVTQSGNPWMFRVRLNDNAKTGAAVDFVLDKLGANSIAVLHDTTTYGAGGFNGIKARLAQRGASSKMVLEQTFQAGDTDFRVQLLNISGAKPDVLIVWGQSAESALILKQMVELGIKIPNLGSSNPPAQPTWGLAGPAASEGAYSIPEPFSGPDAPAPALAFLQKYQQVTAKQPADFALNGYDVIHMIALAAAKAGTDDRVAFREAVRANVYNGLVTQYKFDANGDGVWSLPITRIVNGQPQLITQIVVTK